VGLLKQHGIEPPIFLRSRCLIGRSSVCDVQLNESRISSEHAIVGWTGDAWDIRDLGSKNGTFVGRRRLVAGVRVALCKGQSFRLGSPDEPAPELALIDDEPPVASARHVMSGVIHAAISGFLVVPGHDYPRLSVMEAQDGTWVLEIDGEVRPAVDREVVVVDGEAWSLDLPDATGPTLSENESGAAPPKLALRFRVSLDEEHVQVTVIHAGGEVSMLPRSYHYLLLTLARARLADARAGAQPSEQGWIGREELCRMLATDELRLNVDVCRARKQLAVTGVQGAANLIERLPKTGRIRLGTGLIEIERTPR
jgi:hypothetical protein